MSLAETWGQTLPIDKKDHVKHYLGNLNRTRLNQLRMLLIELTIPSIEDPLKEKHATFLKDTDNVGSLEAIHYFVDNSPYWWHVREWVRFLLGHHRPIPSASFNMYANFAGQFPHISREDPTRVAIVMDMKKAEADLHTTMKIGRFLSKQTDAPESAIPDISNEYANRSNTYVLETARTKAEIQWVYENGPTSCMAKKMDAGVFHTRTHPTHAYATPDIKVLFVRDLTDSNRVISRTVASTITDTYVRIFGNEAVMREVLVAAGITHHRAGGLTNHRLLNIEEQRSGRTMHVGPYLDSGKQSVTIDPDDPKYLIIGSTRPKAEQGKYVGHTERSYTGKGFMDTDPTITCHHCAGEFAEEHITFHEAADYYACNSCRDAHMTMLYGSELDHIYVDENYSDAHIITIATGIGIYRDARRALRTTLQTTSMHFLDQESFDQADVPKYKNNPDVYIRPEDAVWVESKQIFALSEEVTTPSYTHKIYLIEDCVRINNRYVAKEHTKNGMFKFTTLDGFDTQHILDNLSTFYFQWTALTSGLEKIAITAVSKTPKTGYQSLNDFWLNHIHAKHGFDEYSHIKLNELMSLSISACVIPDTDNQLFADNNSNREHIRFRASNFAARKSIKVPPTNTQVCIPQAQAPFRSAIRKKKMRKQTVLDGGSSRGSDYFRTSNTSWTTVSA